MKITPDQIWNADDDARLIQMYTDKTPIAKIAEALGRTYLAVAYRAHRLRTMGKLEQSKKSSATRNKRSVRFVKLDDAAIMPTRATCGSIAFDLAIPDDYVVTRGRQVIPLRFAIEIPMGYEFKIEPRSGFSAKGFLGYALTDTTFSCPHRYQQARVETGKVDSDYRGCVGIIVENYGSESFIIKAGSRIAQGTFYYSDPAWRFVEAEELSTTSRGDGGFGHSGV